MVYREESEKRREMEAKLLILYGLGNLTRIMQLAPLALLYGLDNLTHTRAI